MECLLQILTLLKDWGGGLVTTLIATAAGAHIAFKYQQYADEKKQRDSQITALKIAQRVVHSHWSVLNEVHTFMALNQSDRENRRLNTKELIQVCVMLPLDVPSIAFLLDGKHADLIQQVSLVEGAARTAIEGMQRRAKIIHRLQENSNVEYVDPKTQIYRGDADMLQAELLIQLSESILKNSREGCQKANEIFFSLKAAGEDIFGGQFPTLVDIPPEHPATPSKP